MNINNKVFPPGFKYKNENLTVLSEPSVEYLISDQINYKEKYITELEQQIKLLKELNQNLQKELNKKSEIIQGFLSGNIGLISKKVGKKSDQSATKLRQEYTKK